MSYTNSKKVTPVPTKYCKVCHDLGKSESEYRSHFTRETRDPSSKILCPSLLAMECRYCFKKGHTVKYCPTIKKNEKETKYRNNNNKIQQQPLTKTNNNNNNRNNKFAQFESDSEDEEQEVKQIEEFPELTNTNANTNTNNKPLVFNFKAALESEAEPKPLIIKQVIPPLYKPKPMANIDWTAMSDSEDEDDDFNLESDNDNDNDSYLSRGEAWSQADKYRHDDDW